MKVKLKICGMKYLENIEEISQLEPDMLGFIFYEKSKRNFQLEAIPNIPKSIKRVGVFVNENIDFILQKVSKFKLDFVQLHGEESESFCLDIKNQFAEKQLNIKIVKVFAVGNHFEFDQLKNYKSVDYFLFDTEGKEKGGNGIKFNWHLLQNYTSNKPFFLSGGIGLDDVFEINKLLQSEVGNKIYALDVNSKFEIEPGLKDIIKLQQFKSQLI